MWIFGNNRTGAGATFEAMHQLATMKFYYLRIYQNNEIKYNFISVLDKDGVPCVYDTVGKKFYYNQGTGDFTYEEWDYTPCDYVYTDGDAYLNTLYYGDENTATEVYVKSEDLVYRIAIGSRTSATSNNITTFVCDTQGGVVQDFGNYTITRQVTTEITAGNYVRCYNSKDERWMEEDGQARQTTSTQFTGTLNTQTPIYLGYVGAGTYPAACANFKGNYKEAKIYENGVLVRDLIPVADGDNKGCFYDKTLNALFHSDGTSDYDFGGIIHKKFYNVSISTGNVSGVGRCITHTANTPIRLSTIPMGAGSAGVMPTGTTKDMFNNGGIATKAGDTFVLTVEDGYQTALVLWKSETMQSNTPSFASGSRTYTVPSGDYDRIAIVIRKSDNSNIDVSESSFVKIEKQIYTE